MIRLRLIDLAKQIRATLDARFADERVWVEAETSNIKVSKAGHVYLSLVEKSPSGELLTELSAVVWSMNSGILQQFTQETGQAFTGNLKVCVYVRIAFHERYGLKLAIESIDAAYTIGELALERERILQRLATEYPKDVVYRNGRVHSRNQHVKRAAVIQRIAVLTAPGSDALLDFRHQLDHNAFGYRFEVNVFPVAVQGEQAGELMAIALRKAAETQPDALVLIRGGGSQLDLYAFESFELALAIATCPVPVFTGIGHHRNQAIADLVANQSLSTPTKVAEWFVDYNRSFEELLLTLQDKVVNLSFHFIEKQDIKIDNLQKNFKFLLQTVRERRTAHIDKIQQAVKHGVGVYLERRKHGFDQIRRSVVFGLRLSIERAESRMNSFDAILRHSAPERILQRGFVMLSDAEGRILGSAAQVKAGDKITIGFRDGKAAASIENVTNNTAQ